jgi:hypothetical protein
MCTTNLIFLKYLEIYPTSVQFSAKASIQLTQTKENKNHPLTGLFAKKSNQNTKRNVDWQNSHLRDLSFQIYTLKSTPWCDGVTR